MKKNGVILVFIWVAWCRAGLASVWFIHPGMAFEEIQEKVTKAVCHDTLIFRQGHYAMNNLIIRCPLTLAGENLPVFDGLGKYQIVSIEADSVTLTGFRMINSGFSDMNEISAVRIQNGKHIILSNNILENVCYGIYCINASACIIEKNKIHSTAVNELHSGNGIHCWKSDSMFISKNHITGQRDGIYFEFVTQSEIRDNISERNLRYGLHFMFSHFNHYEGNIFNFNGAGVAVMYSHHVNMEHNTFSQNQGESSYGILMKDISDSRTINNHFTRNTIGIYMEGTSRIAVEQNIFQSNGWAFRIQASCSDIRVENNKFIGNTFDVATNGNLVLNKFYNNYWDKYLGYDLNRDGMGDVPYRPVSLFSMIAERLPCSLILFRSFLVDLMERIEKAMPALTPVDLADPAPLMKTKL